LLLSYLIFALSNVSFNSLYPIFASADPPTGRNLTPREIGLTLGFAGLVTIAFQICIFGKLRDKMGNRWSYRAGLFGFVIAFALMPFVGYKDETAPKDTLTLKSALLAAELCFVLLIKTVSAVGGLTSALLLVRHSYVLFARSSLN
jgi:MFS family permease